MLRVVVLVNAVGLNLYRGVHEFDHPVGGYVLLAVMVAWTGFVDLGLRRRTRVVRRCSLVLDLAVAVALLALTPVVKGEWFDASVPGFWVMAALLAWAIRFRWVGGLVAGSGPRAPSTWCCATT